MTNQQTYPNLSDVKTRLEKELENVTIYKTWGKRSWKKL